MKRIKSILIRFLIHYGKAGAERPSFHGYYETPVPECLKHR